MDEVTVLTGGATTIARIVLVGVVGFTWLVVLLRVTGARTLAKMTPFDFVITVTLGSAFGRVLTAGDVGLVDALVALLLLVVLQWAFAVARSRWSWFKAAVDVEPTVLYLDGRPQQRALRRHRLTPADLESAAREKGRGSLQDVRAVLLQSDGQLAVIGADQWGDGSAVPQPPGGGPGR
jgi:uncharacterized membrane protein YcaP (DUF421 family)